MVNASFCVLIQNITSCSNIKELPELHTWASWWAARQFYFENQSIKFLNQNGIVDISILLTIRENYFQTGYTVCFPSESWVTAKEANFFKYLNNGNQNVLLKDQNYTAEFSGWKYGRIHTILFVCLFFFDTRQHYGHNMTNEAISGPGRERCSLFSTSTSQCIRL